MTPTFLLTLLIAVIPFVLLVVIVAEQPHPISPRSGARLWMANKPFATFASLVLSDEVMESLTDLSGWLQMPERYAALGARPFRGLLIVGPSGTGKTLIAKALAGECKVPFFYITGPDFIGTNIEWSVARLTDLFQSSRRNEPCIVFIDQLDAISRNRNGAIGSEDTDLLMQALTGRLIEEMDGFDRRNTVVVVGTTESIDAIDPIVLNPQRFDRILQLTIPGDTEREKILGILAKGKPIESSVSVFELAGMSRGMTGAGLELWMNEACMVAARENRQTVRVDHFRQALSRIEARGSKS